jgi:hypothetical protein
VSAASGTPTGSVLVHDGGDSCSGNLSGGQGSCTITLRTPGTRTLTADYAAADGFGASSASEPHTVDAAPAPVLTIATQPPSQATSGAVLTPAPAIQLRTADGAELPTAGVTVSVAIASGGGALSGSLTSMTDGSGRAEFADLVITGDPGSRRLVFTADGYGSATSEPIDVAAPAPDPSMSSVSADPAIAGQTSAIRVAVRDAAGNPLEGRTVVLNGAAAAEISPASALTGSDGTAAFDFTPIAAGSRTITAVSTDVTLGTTTLEVQPSATTANAGQ